MKFLKPESNDFLMLDTLRFIASMSIVMYHYKQELSPSLLKTLLSDILFHAELFVDLFFLISGFIIAYVYHNRMTSLKDYGFFMQKRIARLAPLHWLLLIGYLLIWVTTAYMDIPLRNPDKYTASCILPHIFLIQSVKGFCDTVALNYVSWSISAEMIMYLLFPLFLYVFKVSKRLGLILAILIPVILAFIYRDHLNNYVGMTVTNGFIRAIPTFFMGMCVYFWKDAIKNIPNSFILANILLFGFYIISFMVPDMSSLYLLPIIYGIFIFSVISDNEKKTPKSMTGIAGLGQLTYGIYMIYPIIQTIVFAFVIKHVSWG